MRRMTTALSLLVVMVLGFLIPGIATAAALQDTPGGKLLRVNWGDFFPETLDPQLSHSGQWAISGGLDFEGLTRIDEELQVVPGAAESWEFSRDGTILTFHLREGLVFSDGVPVTAEHFRYAVERMCSPDLESESAIQLFDIVGCEERFTRGGVSDSTPAASTGTPATVTLGVRAIDDRTLEIRFDQPAPYFPVVASIWGTIPLREELIEAGGPEWWANPATRIGNGPFRLVTYEADMPNQRLTYARNDTYWGGDTKLDGVEFVFLDYEDPATTEAYRNGELDINWPGEEILPAIEADPVLSRELLTLPVAGTYYYSFNLTREPFQDPQVRAAFAYAFDRDAYCRQLNFGGACTPTLSWISPGAPGHIETDAYAFDPQKAREALATSSYGGPENLPEITWYGIAGDPFEEQVGQWLAAQLRQVLGVELSLAFLSEEDYDALHEDDATWPQFHESAWYADPDPRDWFVVWRCGAEFNRGYCNPELEALLDRADAELDPEARIALYEDAGHMLLADAPAIFVHTASNTMLVKPYVTGYSRTTPNGNWPGWTNLLTVDVERPA
jgi:oligopeptide transport system substrate-binding protein